LKTSNNILVRFHPEIDTPAGIIIPERYTVYNQTMEGDNESRMGVTTDRRLINPQTVDVLSGEYDGQVAFVYYGAYELGKLVDEERYIIPENNLLFLCDPVRPMPGIYLCERIWNEGERSGKLYTTPNAGSYDAIRMRITHTPPDSELKQGQTIITTSPAQYELRYEGHKYVMVRERFIAGYDEDTPYGDNLLVEYLPDADSPERDAYNDKIRQQIDFMKHHGMHYNEADFQLMQPPKFVEAVILKVCADERKYPKLNGEQKKCLIHRNTGVRLSGSRWLLPQEALIAMVV
jgi:hypothetical protein